MGTRTPKILMADAAQRRVAGRRNSHEICSESPRLGVSSLRAVRWGRQFARRAGVRCTPEVLVQSSVGLPMLGLLPQLPEWESPETPFFQR